MADVSISNGETNPPRITAGAFISHIAEQRDDRVHRKVRQQGKDVAGLYGSDRIGEALMTIVPGK